MVQETLRDILQSVFEEAFGSSAMMIRDLTLIDLLASIGMRVSSFGMEKIPSAARKFRGRRATYIMVIISSDSSETKKQLNLIDQYIAPNQY